MKISYTQIAIFEQLSLTSLPNPTYQIFKSVSLDSTKTIQSTLKLLTKS
jgi:hypothetical protein